MPTHFESLLSSLDVSTVLPPEIQFGQALIVDLSRTRPMWQAVGDGNPDEWVLNQMRAIGATMSIGRYNEQRPIYENTEQFEGTPDRDLHIGLDLGVMPGTPLTTPVDATVFSLADHQHQGDYGPTVILRHQEKGLTFFTLYGHLAADTLNKINVGQTLVKGELFGWVGDKSENGGWAPHLHFQIIQDLGEWKDDYPGVTYSNQAEVVLENCPDPNLIIRRDDL
ncbi:peptidase M23 [Veronia nyctiphanis]|uniref:Peptidase M23 n=1 Tax=Veronia nyctiphanis TaxID=1278244 RepID=A0A4Q0YLU0_9GAMM|nr:peptidoglycan DD-metalloendopeptidase family protein [Veronia nyctiphanis]RXJ71777.1 peptidase M23 [Veronia nyctiphanis]